MSINFFGVKGGFQPQYKVLDNTLVQLMEDDRGNQMKDMDK